MDTVDRLMTRILGANWITTVFGWLAILACAIHFDPTLAAFLPESVAKYVVGFSGWIAVLFAGITVSKVKDARVTGGVKPATFEAEIRTGADITPRDNNISTIVKVAALSALIIGFQGCAHQGVSSDDPQNVATNKPVITADSVRNAVHVSIPYIRPPVFLACSGVLNFALSDTDRIDKANLIYSVAMAVRSLCTGVVPEPAEVKNVIALWMPEKTHWANLATTISGFYSGLFEQLKGDPLLAVQVLEQIARGCEDAAGAVKGIQ